MKQTIIPNAQPKYHLCLKPKRKIYEYNWRESSNRTCQSCNKLETTSIESGNKIIDDFIRYTHTNHIKRPGKMEFVPFEKFKNVEYIAEGGFSKIYKATWIGGPSNLDVPLYYCGGEKKVALKELHNSENITSEQLNEVQYYYTNFDINLNLKY